MHAKNFDDEREGCRELHGLREEAGRSWVMLGVGWGGVGGWFKDMREDTEGTRLFPCVYRGCASAKQVG